MNKPYTQIQQITDKFIGIIHKYGDYNEYHPDVRSPRGICMAIEEIQKNDFEHPNDGTWVIPKMEILYKRRKDTHEEQIVIELMVSRTPYSPYSSDSTYSDWLSSDVCREYAAVMNYHLIYGGEIQILFGTKPELDKLATLLTRIVSVFGATESTRWDTSFSFNYTHADMSLARLHENLIPSIALHNAIRDCMESCRKYGNYDGMGIFLNIGIKDPQGENLLINVDGESVSMDYGLTEDLFEKVSHYQNLQCLDISHCGDTIMEAEVFDVENMDFCERLLTDYILFLNPGATIDNIVVTAIFDFYAYCENDAKCDKYKAYRVDYLGDGTSRSEKTWEECEKFQLKLSEDCDGEI